MKVKTYLQNFIKVVATFALALLVGFPWQTVTPTRVSAYTEGANLYDSTPVLEDLGEDYILKFPEVPGAEPKLNSFVEYSYSDNAFTRNASYGLYLYVYNPSRTKYSTKTGASVVNMATAYNAKGNPSEYNNLPLKVCGYTTGKYDKLFYKFRIMNVEKVLNNAVAQEGKNGKRRYDIASVQLKDADGGVEDYKVAKIFYYSGYGKGCGKGAEIESTLTHTYEEGETISLDVHPTTYRPAGNNGKNEYTQDSLHSVWFSVPNRLIEKYGEMYAVHATWLDATLKPALVTGNKNAYNAILQYLGKDIGEHCEDLNYAYLGAMRWNTIIQSTVLCEMSYNADLNSTFTPIIDFGTGYCISSNKVNPLYLMFDAGSGTNSADNYVVSPTRIEEEALKSAMAYGGSLIAGKYSSAIFSSVAEKYTDVNITADEKRYLTEIKVDKNWWEKTYGGAGDIVSEKFDSIDAVKKITNKDLVGSPKDVCNSLYISTSDYNDLMADYSVSEKNDESIYLLRYQVSDYIVQEATLFEETKTLGMEDWQEIDTNAYFFQETVNLEFEIIDVTFKKEEVLTVVPVVMSPIDIFLEGTGALDTTDDTKLGNKWSFTEVFEMILGIIVLLFVVWAVCKVLGWVINALRGGGG